MSKIQNPPQTREGARSWDPYFKQSNVKKLKNLLEKALKKGETTVKLKNDKTITVFELEQLIHEKEVDPYIKHYLTSTKPEDTIPWYKSSVKLSLMYKDQKNNKYVDEAVMDLTKSQSEYSFNTDPSLEKHNTFTYTHLVYDKSGKDHYLDYQVNVQKYPSNKVFVNKSRIDLFTYNLAYLFIGERNHDAKSNNSLNDFVPFVTDFEIKNKRTSYYTTADAYKKSFKSPVKDIVNKTGLTYTKSQTYQLAYVVSDENILTLDKTLTTEEGGEMWGFGGSIYLVPQYSSNYNAQRTNSEISTAYTQTGLIFKGDTATVERIDINPYISGKGWYTMDGIDIKKKENEKYITVANQYQNILKHKDKLQGCVYVYTHPITCSLTPVNAIFDVEYSYLTNMLDLDIANSIKYAYTIDGSSKQNYDFSTKDYTYNYINGKTNIVVNLPKLSTSYTLKQGSPEIGTYTTTNNVIKFKDSNTIYGKDYTLLTKSSLIDPITNKSVSDEQNLTFNISPRSNPSFGSKDIKVEASISVNKETAETYMNLNVKFTYEKALIKNIHGIKNSEDSADSAYTYMFTETTSETGSTWSYNESCDIDSSVFAYSYLFDNGGIVDRLEKDTYTTVSRTYELVKTVGEERYPYLTVQYSYNITYDNTKLTKPKVNVLSEPQYNISYIADKAIVYIISDDFNIWCDNPDIKTFNTDDNTHFVKNSYIICDSTVNEKLRLTYQHKADTNIGYIDITTYNYNSTNGLQVKKNNYEYTGITYEVSDMGISTHWDYKYTDIYEFGHTPKTHVFEYKKLDLVSTGSLNVKLNCDTIDELVYKAIPNVVFKTLYNNFNVDNMENGFCLVDNDDRLPYPYVGSGSTTIKPKYVFKPKFGIILDTITELIYINGQPYPLESEYYIVQINNEYYLYCVFNSVSTATQPSQQILPPLLYHISAFSEDTTLNNKDYEYYTENQNIVLVNLTCPTSIKNTYMLYGFNKDIVNSISTTQNYVPSFYNSLNNPTSFIIPYDNDGNNCCYLDCKYEFDGNQKLKQFKNKVDKESYTYINKYTGFITRNDCWSDGTFEYTDRIPTAQKIKKVELFAYVTTSFDNKKVQPTFRIFNYNENILTNTSEYVFYPSLITGYPEYELPQEPYEPIIDTFTPDYSEQSV